MSAVLSGVAANLVTGRTNGTWSISCSDPWPQRIAGARPPSTTIGELFCSADAIALMPLVTPGPAVSAATPGSRVTFAQPSAANAAADSWRTATRATPHARPTRCRHERAPAVVEREQVPAREREQLRDAVRLQAPGDEPPAVEPCDLLGLGVGAHGT